MTWRRLVKFAGTVAAGAVAGAGLGAALRAAGAGLAIALPLIAVVAFMCGVIIAATGGWPS